MRERSTYRQQTVAALRARMDRPLSPRVREVLAGFETGRALVQHQRDLTIAPDPKDDVLVALLRLQGDTPRDPEPNELLLAAMFPVVDRLFFSRVRRAKRGANGDATFGAECWWDETWSLVMEAFLAVTLTYPLGRRPRKIAGNIAGLLLHWFGARDLAESRRAEAERWLATNVAPLLQGAPAADTDEPSIGLFDLTQDEEPPAPAPIDEVASLDRKLEEAGVADPLNRAIVIGVVVHGRSFSAVGDAFGMKKVTVQKRFGRARTRLARWIGTANPPYPIERNEGLIGQRG